MTVKNEQELDRILLALLKNDICNAEITFRTDYAPKAIEYAVKNYPNMTIGAGTILNLEQCKTAINNGAKFIVSPGLDGQVAKYCKTMNVDYYPGCVTPTEIMSALQLGINIVKFFPSNIYGGTMALKALGAPFSNVKFIPTGGVDRNNVDQYLSMENVWAVGGSFLVEESLRKMEKKV